MADTINSDLIRGNIDTIVLKMLVVGDRYGYDIVSEISKKTNGLYKIKQPSLYSSLKRLEEQGFIRSYWGTVSSGSRRKYYSLTDLGKEIFIKYENDWQLSRTIIDTLISDKQVNLYDESLKKLTTDESISEVEEEKDTESTMSILNSESETSIKPQELIHKSYQENENTNQEIKQETQVKFTDTESIMKQLFNQEQKDALDKSYAEKVNNDKFEVSAKSSFTSQNYFKDFVEESDYLDGQISTDEEMEIKASTPNQTISKSEKFEKISQNDSVMSDKLPPLNERIESIYNRLTENKLSEPKPASPPQQEPEKFYSYDASLEQNETKSFIEREYKNVLTNLVKKNSVEAACTTMALKQPSIELSKETTASKLENFDGDEYEVSPIEALTKDKDVNKKFNKLSINVKEMGDIVKIRTHNSDTSKEYNNTYYYLCNKLMLTHYGIIAGIMLLETIFCFLFIRIGMKIVLPYDLALYLCSVIASAALPITACFLYLNNPAKKKRINFSFSNSLSYRLILMGLCFLIIYCLNIYFKMPLTFSSNYLSTLVLPALLVMNFPLSAIVFNSLYKSKKYNGDLN